MIATDNHLGYYEKDSNRRNDSFLAIEEVLKTANEHNCDFVILGGDLFHDNNPSKYTLNRAMTIFSQHVLGANQTSFDTISEKVGLNYLDPNFNIKLPVFIIHGNHDDPSADTNISAINLMQSAHFLNYIKTVINEESVIVKPVILLKQNTCVYIYGLGNIKEERLNRLLNEDKVVFERPENEKNAVFILVVHQNRYKGNGLGPSSKNCIMDWAFPKFFDIIIWGHEHDSFTEPRTTQNREYRIYQPGSTVSTSLTEGEARTKHMFLLEIKNLAYKMTPIPLMFSRQILFKHVDLREISQNSNDLVGSVTEIFDSLIRDADRGRKIFPPLVRIKIEVTGFEDFPGFALNSKFCDRAGNKDVVTLWRRAPTHKEDQTKPDLKSGVGFDDILKLMTRELSSRKTEFSILNAEQFIEKISEFVEKGENNGLEDYFDRKVEMACAEITKSQTTFDEAAIKKKVNELDISAIELSIKRKPDPHPQKCRN